uniref:Uncharacterized protein n=1 Tax=Arundo donax TaxID=35708 RepID=A0A0A9FPM3_ARUDO
MFDQVIVLLRCLLQIEKWRDLGLHFLSLPACHPQAPPGS